MFGLKKDENVVKRWIDKDGYIYTFYCLTKIIKVYDDVNEICKVIVTNKKISEVLVEISNIENLKKFSKIEINREIKGKIKVYENKGNIVYEAVKLVKNKQITKCFDSFKNAEYFINE